MMIRIFLLFISFLHADDSIFYNQLSVKDEIVKFMAEKEYLTKTELCDIMTIWGSDKGAGWHNYTTLYMKLFAQWKDKPLHIFELGIGSINPQIPSNMGPNGVPGASLVGWSKFFRNAAIFGADIDRNILFKRERIKTFFCDQRNRESIDIMYASVDLQNVTFDLMIDDGLHDFYANKTFLEKSIHKLKKGGVYIIENVHSSYYPALRYLLPHLKSLFSLTYVDIIDMPSNTNNSDNRLLIIQK